MISYQLHLPIGRKEARKRKLDDNISKLVVEPGNSSYVNQILSECVYRCKIEDKVLVAQTIIRYDSIKNIKETLDQHTIRNWTDDELSSNIRKPSNFVMSCDSAKTVLTIINGIQSEAITFYNLKTINDNIEFNENIIDASLDGYSETSFLKHLDEVGFFCFYASSHNSIELLGKKELILKYFFDITNKFEWK
jgi:hypothetical protein